MKKLSIEQQITELTPEQRNNMGKIYKKYVISLVSLVIIGVLLSLVIFAAASIKEERAENRYDRYQTELAINPYDFSLMEASSDAFDEYMDIAENKYLSFVLGGSFILLGCFVVYFIFKIKYPYFSEKKYSYLKKIQNNQLWQ